MTVQLKHFEVVQQPNFLAAVPLSRVAKLPRLAAPEEVSPVDSNNLQPHPAVAASVVVASVVAAVAKTWFAVQLPTAPDLPAPFESDYLLPLMAHLPTKADLPQAHAQHFVNASSTSGYQDTLP